MGWVLLGVEEFLHDDQSSHEGRRHKLLFGVTAPAQCHVKQRVRNGTSLQFNPLPFFFNPKQLGCFQSKTPKDYTHGTDLRPESLHVTGPTFRCGSWRDYWERPNENCLSSTLPSRSNSKDATFGTPGLTRNTKLGAPGIATNGARTLQVEFSIDDCPRCSGLDPERGV